MVLGAGRHALCDACGMWHATCCMQCAMGSMCNADFRPTRRSSSSATSHATALAIISERASAKICRRSSSMLTPTPPSTRPSVHTRRRPSVSHGICVAGTLTGWQPQHCRPCHRRDMSRSRAKRHEPAVFSLRRHSVANLVCRHCYPVHLPLIPIKPVGSTNGSSANTSTAASDGRMSPSQLPCPTHRQRQHPIPAPTSPRHSSSAAAMFDRARARHRPSLLLSPPRIRTTRSLQRKPRPSMLSP